MALVVVGNYIERGCALGDEKRMGATTEKIGLQMTLRPEIVPRTPRPM